MRAAVVKDFTQPLEITEVATPEPAPGEVLVRVEASGLCHTDIHAARGEWPAVNDAIDDVLAARVDARAVLVP